MRILRVTVCGLALLVSTQVRAETVELSLPSLHGTYPLDGSVATRTTSFKLPRVPRTINGATFRISGTTEIGEVWCEWGGPYPWLMQFLASMDDTAFAHVWMASVVLEEPGRFTAVVAFQPSPHTTTWTFLMDGEGEISLFGAPVALVGLCSGTQPSPTAVVDEAVLIVDAELPVPVEQTTWGRIKAVFSRTP